MRYQSFLPREAARKGSYLDKISLAWSHFPACSASLSKLSAFSSMALDALGASGVPCHEPLQVHSGATHYNGHFATVQDVVNDGHCALDKLAT